MTLRTKILLSIFLLVLLLIGVLCVASWLILSRHGINAQTADNSLRYLYWLFAGVGIAAVLSGMLVTRILVLSRLSLVQQQLGNFLTRSAGNDNHLTEPSGDEISCISGTITSMLDELKGGEERLRLAVHHSPLPTCIHAEGGEILLLSESWTELSGYTLQEIPTIQAWVQHAHKDEGEKALSLVHNVYNIEKPVRNGIMPIQTRDGEQRIWHFNASPIGTLPDGRRAVMVVALDITERNLTEEALRSNEEKERAFQTSLKALHQIRNEFSRVQSVDELCKLAVILGRENLSFERLSIWLTSNEPDVLIGTFGIDETGQLRDERGRRLIAEGPRGINRVLKDRSRVLVEDDAPLYNHNAERVGTGSRAVAALWNGTEVIGCLCIDNFISRSTISEQQCELLELYAVTLGHMIAQLRMHQALQERETIFLKLADVLPFTIALCQESRFLYVNKAAEQLSGYTRDELLQKDPIELIRSTSQPHMRLQLNKLLRKELLSAKRDLRIHRQLGEERWVEIIAISLQYETQPCVLVTALDITERKNGEASHREQLRQREALLTALSHEFLTPLTSILGWVQVARDTQDQEKVNHALTVIERNAIRQKRLAGDLLEVSRILQQTLSVTHEFTDLSSLAAQSIENIRQTANEHGIALHMHVTGEFFPVHADPIRIQQAVEHLLQNAMTLTGKGGTVTLSCFKQGTYAVATVQGSRQSELTNELSPALDPTFQGNRTFIPDELGLALARGIIEAHKGIIEIVEPEDGHFSVFRIKIPLAESPVLTA